MTAVAERAHLTPLAPTRKLEVACHQCGSYVGKITLSVTISPGMATTQMKCPNRRCGSWNVIDIATGKSESGRARLTA